MEITMIHGQSHKGSTYHISTLIAKKLSRDDTIIYEYFMPKDTPSFCVGCFQCIQKGEEYCPQADKVQVILASMLRSDLIIIDSPNYCFEMTGQLKTLFDHLAYIWMSHRPRREMFDKIGIVVSTAAGGGAGSVTKSLARQLFWWGVPQIYRMNVNVNAMSWVEVPEKVKQKIDRKVTSISRKASHKLGKSKFNIKSKFIFTVMSKMQKSNTWNLTDRNYWESKLWQ
ncbi:MAG: NAD(P)H-dependent oxidoreductase [Mobilitalea sp.]